MALGPNLDLSVLRCSVFYGIPFSVGLGPEFLDTISITFHFCNIIV